ncbi:helix-turn-helix domain-containing protein [Streptomyces sp. NPDC127108]|uniref:helix-turn-helix domain-containing protein n=1 Tax=Streptomyces sp. NPDC127108 TaxID=3345361 RepID=UPI00363EE8DB
MPRWKELPASLGEQERRLAVQLRRMKDRSGLSLTSLATRTSYSRSSWERYLNGKKPVPRAAVEQLSRVCGTEPTRLLVLHEVAQEARVSAGAGPGRPAGATATAPHPPPEPPPAPPAPAPPEAPPPSEAPAPPPTPARAPRTVRLRTALAALALAVAAAFTGGLLADRAWEGADGEVRGAHVYEKGRAYGCEDGREGGVRYAGHSRTRDSILDRGDSGWEVVEVQCLLGRHGYGAGATDGVYGDRTKAAVRRFQWARGLVDDGIVRPETWGELRK